MAPHQRRVLVDVRAQPPRLAGDRASASPRRRPTGAPGRPAAGRARACPRSLASRASSSCARTCRLSGEQSRSGTHGAEDGVRAPHVPDVPARRGRDHRSLDDRPLRQRREGGQGPVRLSGGEQGVGPLGRQQVGEPAGRRQRRLERDRPRRAAGSRRRAAAGPRAAAPPRAAGSSRATARGRGSHRSATSSRRRRASSRSPRSRWIQAMATSACTAPSLSGAGSLVQHAVGVASRRAGGSPGRPRSAPAGRGSSRRAADGAAARAPRARARTPRAAGHRRRATARGGPRARGPGRAPRVEGWLSDPWTVGVASTGPSAVTSLGAPERAVAVDLDHGPVASGPTAGPAARVARGEGVGPRHDRGRRSGKDSERHEHPSGEKNWCLHSSPVAGETASPHARSHPGEIAAPPRVVRGSDEVLPASGADRVGAACGHRACGRPPGCGSSPC